MSAGALSVGTVLAAVATVFMAADAVAREGTVLILSNTAFAADDKRLVESLHIYTRDIGSRVVIAGEAPAVVETSGLEQIARQARKESADIVVWTSRRSDGAPVFYVLSVRDLDLRETDIALLGGDRAAEAVALKVRTLLSRPLPRTAASEAAAADAPPGGGQAPASAGARGADLEAKVSPAPAPAPGPGRLKPGSGGAGPPKPDLASGRPGPSHGVPAGGPSPPQAWAALGVAYGVAAPFDRAWLRQGLTVSAEVRLGHGRLAAHLDGAFTRASEVTGTSFTATLGDVPLGAGVLLRWQTGPISLAAGPRATLHLIHVQSSSADGRTGSTREVSAGLGVLGQVELEWRERIRFFAGVSCEALVPARTFTVDESPALRTGGAQVGTLLGVAVLIP